MNARSYQQKTLIRLIVTVHILTGCGGDSPDLFIHDDLAPILEEFKRDAEYFGVVIPVSNLLVIKRVSADYENYGTTLGSRASVGVCLKIDEDNIVTKDESWSEIWVTRKYTPPCMLKLLMYHELGHCLLNLSHTDEPLIMYSSTIRSEDRCQDDWEGLKESLFLEGK